MSARKPVYRVIKPKFVEDSARAQGPPGACVDAFSGSKQLRPGKTVDREGSMSLIGDAVLSFIGLS
jgi:hypothetical protein